MGALVRFRGGGSLDGAELELPAHVTGAVTTERDGGRSYYELDDSGAFSFTGLNDTGREMGNIMRTFTAAAKAEREAIAAAAAAQGCRSCGRTFANAAAFAIHREGARCLSDTAHGQLVQIDGAVWDEAWRHPELRR